jgi:hypothetical protein
MFMTPNSENDQMQGIQMHRLDNPTHYQLIRTTVDRAQSDAVVMRLVGEAVDALEEALRREEEVLKTVQKSPLTASIKAVNGQRNQTYRFIRGTVRISLKNPAPGKRASAQRLMAVVKRYSIRVDDPYDRKTALMENLLNDLQRDYVEEVHELSLEEALTNLRTQNNRFYQLLNERTASQIDKQVGATRRARIASDRCFADLRHRINAQALLGNGEALASFITFMNLEITRLKQQVLHLHGTEADGGEDNTR